jgi:hypothetical protein
MDSPSSGNSGPTVPAAGSPNQGTPNLGGGVSQSSVGAQASGRIRTLRSRLSQRPTVALADAGSSAIAPSGGGLGSAGGIVQQAFQMLFGGGGWNQVPQNIIHNMQPNQLLKDAIKQTMNTAFPQAKLNIAISPNLKLGYQDAGVYENMDQYSAYLRALSFSILGSGNNYQGIKVTPQENSVNFHDGTSPLGSATLQFYDLIGQPTWTGRQSIVIKTVMRSDIHIGWHITLPPNTLMTMTGEAAGLSGQQSGRLTFQGTFLVTKVLHIGDSRNPDGSAWVTNFYCNTEDTSNKSPDNTSPSIDAQNIPIGGGAGNVLQAPTGTPTRRRYR